MSLSLSSKYRQQPRVDPEQIHPRAETGETNVHHSQPKVSDYSVNTQYDCKRTNASGADVEGNCESAVRQKKPELFLMEELKAAVLNSG